MTDNPLWLQPQVMQELFDLGGFQLLLPPCIIAIFGNLSVFWNAGVL